MKKLSLIIAICLSVFFLSSCRVPYGFSQDVTELDQIQIEIVNLEIEMGYHAGESYNEEYITVIKVIENDKKEEFISDFMKIKSYQPNVGSRIESVRGEAIRIRYPNGDVELITDFGTATVKNGKISNQTTTFDDKAFSALLAKYS